MYVNISYTNFEQGYQMNNAEALAERSFHCDVE